MTSILIFLLFMLNILTILAVILLFQRQNRLIEMEKSGRDDKEEAAELFSAFLLELKSENEHFISKVNQIQEDKGLSQSKGNREKQGTKDELQLDIKQESPITSNTYSELLAYQSYSKEIDLDLAPSKESKEITKDISLSDQVSRLYDDGLTIDEIAKTLQRGKTEIELMLKFRRSSQNT